MEGEAATLGQRKSARCGVDLVWWLRRDITPLVDRIECSDQTVVAVDPQKKDALAGWFAAVESPRLLAAIDSHATNPTELACEQRRRMEQAR